MSALPPPDPNFGEKAFLLLISLVLVYIFALEILELISGF